MAFSKPLLICLLAMLFALPFSAYSAVSVSYLEPKSTEDKAILDTLKKEKNVDFLIQKLNDTFIITEDLNIVFGADDGPLYDPQYNEILIPYFFVQEVRERFKGSNYDETGISSEQATSDALIHTLLHEIGHAFIIMYNLPVVGKEEDAADSLAVILMMQFYENGDEMAISAADLFELEDADIELFEEADFWGEHSLDIQRFYATLCQVYGSAPEKHKMIVTSELLSEEKARQCESDFSITESSWMTLLEPYRLDILD